MPGSAHVPGRTPHPEDGPLQDVARSAPARTEAAAWRENAAYLYGVQLYQAGFFWEAHEVWEPVWMGAVPNSRERALLQGLIQLANACLKLRMERRRAALRLLAQSEAALGDASRGPLPLMGLEVDVLKAAVERHARSVAADETAEWDIRGCERRPELRLDEL